MGRIQILPDHLISQIAAGEVVERPASVVKELLENALDAGATRLEIQLAAGGRSRIRIADDGTGMSGDDVLLAFDRHATSKIGSFEDLERVASLGFRGEALASIAAVSRTELVTATVDGEGHRVRIEGGRVRSVEPVARERGTTVEVASLFFNVPARRSFLKRPATELRRCLEVVQGYALARPDVSFTVAGDERELLRAVAAPGQPAALRERIGELFGDRLAQHLEAIDGGGSGERFHGYVGDRETTRGRRIFVFVNGRLLRDRALMAVFYRTVRETWHQDEFPALFLALELPPETVDVNVHPQKAEVRLRDPRVLDRVAAALRDALERARGVEEAPLRAAMLPPGGLAWEPAATAADGAGSSWVAESGPESAAARLALLTLRPLERAPVPLSGRDGRQRPFRLLGQYKGTLLLLEGGDGLYLIDQHVAHERILYERFRRQLQENTVPGQALLEPLQLHLSRVERLRLLELAADLEDCGFEVVELSGESVGVTGIPSALDVDAAEALLQELAGTGESVDESADLRRRLLEGHAASRACRGAIKMHDPLTPEAMESLVQELFRCENPYACPHGRPTVLAMSDAELERRFGRR